MDIAELRAIAEAATPGEWAACRDGECRCGQVWAKQADMPVCEVHDEWGDAPDLKGDPDSLQPSGYCGLAGRPEDA